MKGAARWHGPLLWTLALSNVAPLFGGGPLPFTDLPEHVAVMAALQHWFDAAWRIREHYVYAGVASPNLLYHLAGAALAVAMGNAEIANRVLLAAAGVALPFAFRSLLRSFRRDERLTLFAFPLFWNRALLLGLLPYVASIPVFLYAMSLAVRQAERPSRRGFAALASLALAVFYLHASTYAVLVATAFGIALSSPRRSAPQARLILSASAVAAEAARMGRRLAWLAPSAVAAALWAGAVRLSLRSASLADGGEIARIGLARAAYGFELWTHDIWTSHWDEAYALMYWAAFGWILLARLGPSRADEPGPPAAAYAALASVAALYFVLPFRVGAATMLSVRIAPLLALFAVPLLTPARGRNGWIPLALAAAAAGAVPVVSAFEIARIDREEMVDVDALLAPTRPGSHLVELNFLLSSRRTHFPPWPHVGAYYRVRKGGAACFSFAQLPHWPLSFRPEATPPRHLPFWEFAPCTFRNAHDGPYYDYALVRGALDPFRDRPPGPAWRLLKRDGDFALFEKTDAPWPAWSEPDEGPCRARSGSLAGNGASPDP